MSSAVFSPGGSPALRMILACLRSSSSVAQKVCFFFITSSSDKIKILQSAVNFAPNWHKFPRHELAHHVLYFPHFILVLPHFSLHMTLICLGKSCRLQIKKTFYFLGCQSSSLPSNIGSPDVTPAANDQQDDQIR